MRPREWVPIGTLTAEQIRRIEAQMTLDEFCRVLEREVAREWACKFEREVVEGIT
jgi:hypothetical protein